MAHDCKSCQKVQQPALRNKLLVKFIVLELASRLVVGIVCILAINDIFVSLNEADANRVACRKRMVQKVYRDS